MAAPILEFAQRHLIEEARKPLDNDRPIGLIAILAICYKEQENWWNLALADAVLDCCVREQKDDKSLSRLTYIKVPAFASISKEDFARLLTGLDDVVAQLVRGTTVQRFILALNERAMKYIGNGYVPPELALLSVTLVDYAHGRMDATPAGKAFADFIATNRKAIHEGFF